MTLESKHLLVGNNYMPEFLEKKLKKEYGKNSKIPYKIMNKLGVMKGNKETKKGKQEEKKHREDSKGLRY